MTTLTEVSTATETALSTMCQNQFNLSPEKADELVKCGLLPFIKLSSDSNNRGSLYPSPAVAEVLEQIEICGPEDFKALIAELSLAEPKMPAELVQAYERTLDLVRSSNCPMPEAVWPEKEVYENICTSCCKYHGSSS